MFVENPQAFPSPPNSLVPGMTLRDYFAGQALAGFTAKFGNSGEPVDFAVDAYKFADALIAARQEPSA